MRLQELMSQSVQTVPFSMEAGSARRLMQRQRVRHLVVVDGREIVGILSERDLGGPRPRGSADSRPVGEVMSKAVITARPETTVRQAANLLRGHGIGCLPVVRGAKLVGIITTSDLLDLLGRGLEKPVARVERWTMKNRGPRRMRMPGPR